jgi:hypothetical protein
MSLLFSAPRSARREHDSRPSRLLTGSPPRVSDALEVHLQPGGAQRSCTITMYLKSLYPDIPEFPPTNIHDVCLSRRPADAPDFCFQIDGATGQTRSWNEVKARVAHAMTALGAPESKGGLDLRPENGEIVGVLSPNSLVSSSHLIRRSR